MQNTREHIFDKALELFGQKGYDAVSIRTITRAVGIKESSFYNHFPGKGALLEEIFNLMERNLQQSKPDTQQIDRLTDELTLEDYLRRGLDGFMANWRHPHATRIWSVVSMEQYRNKRAARLIIEESERVMKHLSTAFFFFQQKRKMKEGDPMLLAHLYGFSMRAIHLDYSLREVGDSEPQYSLNKMYRTMELFARSWQLE